MLLRRGGLLRVVKNQEALDLVDFPVESFVQDEIDQ